MTATTYFDRGSLVDDVVRAMARAIITPFLLAFWLLAALAAHWRPVALCAGTVGAVALCVAVPLLPLGLGIVAAVGVLTYPRPRTAVRSCGGC